MLMNTMPAAYGAWATAMRENFQRLAMGGAQAKLAESEAKAEAVLHDRRVRARLEAAGPDVIARLAGCSREEAIQIIERGGKRA